MYIFFFSSIHCHYLLCHFKWTRNKSSLSLNWFSDAIFYVYFFDVEPNNNTQTMQNQYSHVIFSSFSYLLGTHQNIDSRTFCFSTSNTIVLYFLFNGNFAKYTFIWIFCVKENILKSLNFLFFLPRMDVNKIMFSKWSVKVTSNILVSVKIPPKNDMI